MPKPAARGPKIRASRNPRHRKVSRLRFNSLDLSGTAANLAESVPAFAAGTALWATALLLISIPREFAMWVRVFGVAASILFAITAMRIFMGEQLLPISSPLPFFGYPFLVITFIGWIWGLLKANV